MLARFSARLMKKVDGALGHAAAWAHRRPTVALSLGVALALLAAFEARHLRLDNDLAGLLPRSFESVQGFDKLRAKFGGVGHVTVAGYGTDRAGLERFVEEITPKLEALPGIRFVEWKRESRFFKDRMLYYLTLEDLKEVEHRIKERERYERRQKNPMYIKLDEEIVPSLDFSDIERKYGGQSSRRLAGSGEEYYLDAKQGLAAVLAKPAGNSLDLDFSVKVVEEVRKVIEATDLTRYGPNFKVQLTGAYPKKVDGQAQIVRDVGRSSTVALLLLLAYLLFHFRSFVGVGLTLVPVAAGLLFTYGFVGAVYGKVNLMTAFLAAILGGLSVEHGIHLLGRYEALRDDGETSAEATREAFSHTGGAALISATVAALTFLSLAISEFRAFREFGVIAAVGMVISFTAYLLFLPALLSVASRHGWKPRRRDRRAASRLAEWLLRPRFRRAIASSILVVLVLLGINARNVRFNYDINALEDQSIPSFVFDKKTNKLLGYSQTPVVVLTPDPASERAVVQELTRRKQQKGAASHVDFVGALDDLVPQQQEEKQAVFASIRESLAKVKRDSLDANARTKFDELQQMVEAQPFTRADLPEGVRRQFLGIDEGQTGFVLIFPAISLSDGAKVVEFAKEVRSIQLGGGQQLSAAGEAMMLADIIAMVTKEMPIIFGAALISVLLTMTFTLGGIRPALLCLLPTLVSIFALFGLMPLLGVSFNYLNVIVLTVLIGTTVDAGVHLVSRLSSAGADFISVYAETGRAISGGILTSAVGFSAMLLADHPGLNSVGQLAILGFATNLAIMLVGFPAVALPFIRREEEPEPDAAVRA